MRLVIITGGETGEREVSIQSANNIKGLLDFAEVTICTFPEEKQVFLDSVKEFDLVIPMIHGQGGEDGSLQELLNNLNIPFLFSDVGTHNIGIDKQATKEAAQSLNIISPKNSNHFPLFIKPRYGGSSVFSKICESQEDLDMLLKANPETEFIMEYPIKGREFTVGIIESNSQTIPLPVIEIIPPGKFFDFESKYNPEKLAKEICPAEIDTTLSAELQRQALLIHVHLRAKHVSRSDFIVTSENEIYFLEINTIPGMTSTSLIPKMVLTAGLSLGGLFKEWCLSELD